MLNNAKYLTLIEIDFLKESNAIEREYSDEALDDSMVAWTYAKKNKGEFDLEFIGQIHNLLLKRLNKRIAGKYRNVPVYIRYKNEYKPCLNQALVLPTLNNWCIRQNTNPPTTVEEIKHEHVAFENIHPFEDGNGRVGRILMNLQMIKAGLPLLIIHEGKEQFKYYEWFKDDND